MIQARLESVRLNMANAPSRTVEDPNLGHYKTQEEIDAYRERIAEADTASLQEGIAKKETENVSASSRRPSVTSETPRKGSQFAGSVPLPEDSKIELPGHFGSMSKREQVQGFLYNWYFSDSSMANQEGEGYLQERKDYLNRAFGYDVRTGETFMDKVSRLHSPLLNSKVDTIGKSSLFPSSRDSLMDSYMRKNLPNLSLDARLEGATIDFSNPDSPITVKDNKALPKLRGANEAVKNVTALVSTMESNRRYQEEIGFLSHQDRGSWLDDDFSKEVDKVLLDDRELKNGEAYHFYKEYLRNYAKISGLEGVAPDESIRLVFLSGYRMPEKDVKSVIGKSAALYEES